MARVLNNTCKSSKCARACHIGRMCVVSCNVLNKLPAILKHYRIDDYSWWQAAGKTFLSSMKTSSKRQKPLLIWPFPLPWPECPDTWSDSAKGFNQLVKIKRCRSAVIVVLNNHGASWTCHMLNIYSLRQQNPAWIAIPAKEDQIRFVWFKVIKNIFVKSMETVPTHPKWQP